MTIVASVKVRDGLILGTDSMTTISSSVGVLKTYSHARKLFAIDGRPVGVMTYGLGNIGSRSIEGLVLDFRRSLSGSHGTVEDVAKHLYSFIKGHYDQEFASVAIDEQPVLGFMVAGYSKGAPLPEEFEFQLPADPAPSPVRAPDAFGASWRGINSPFTRLYKGFDPRLLDALKAQGVSDQDIDNAMAGMEATVIYDGMPVQDALNFAVYILDTTIGYTAFEMGPDSCGRPLQVATILADDGFKWVANPELRVPNHHAR